MKNIVVGIDFSQNSINALRHAVAVSLKTKAKIHIVWVKTPGASSKLGITNDKTMIKVAQEKLDELVHLSKTEAPKSEIHSLILEGKAFLELTQYAGNLPDSMLVVGSHGVSGFEEMFVGSNTMKIVGLSKVPVLIIGNNVQINRDLTKILAPIDTSFETLQKIKTAINCCKYFAAKLILLGVCAPCSVETKHIITVQLNHAITMCEAAGIRYSASTIDVRGISSKATVEWARNEDVNLMVIMREEEDDISAFWLGSNTRQLMNYATMPLLVIPNVNRAPITK